MVRIRQSLTQQDRVKPEQRFDVERLDHGDYRLSAVQLRCKVLILLG